MILKSAILAALLAPILLVTAEDFLTVFGLPLGGKFEAPKSKCSMSEIGADAPRRYCWIERFEYKGSRSGGIQLPDNKNFPIWAQHSTLAVSMGKDGVLNSLTVKVFDEKASVDIVKSISSRFGVPAGQTTTSTGQVVDWNDQDVGIRMICIRSGCSVKFSSARERSALAKEIAARKAVDAARPTSP